MRHVPAITCVLSCFLVHAVAAATVTGRVEVTTGPGTSPAPLVVYAEPLDRSAPVRPVSARIVQKDKAFTPQVLAVPVGSTIEFPNVDPIFHNVFSLSTPAPFDLGLYRAGEAKKRVFLQPGAYRVFCNIHPQMTAFIVVAPTPHVTIAGPDGRYSFDLPAGTYRVTARSDRAAAVSVDVIVGQEPMAAPDLTLDESRYVASRHRN
jgi:plastocyanin